MTRSEPLVDSPSSSGTIGLTSGLRKLHTFFGITDSTARLPCFVSCFPGSFWYSQQGSGKVQQPHVFGQPLTLSQCPSGDRDVSVLAPPSPSQTARDAARSQDSACNEGRRVQPPSPLR